MRVALVVGHARDAQGARAVDGVTEWVWNTTFATMIHDELAALGVTSKVFMRPTVPNRMKVLTDQVNVWGPDLVLSLHFNSVGDPGPRGALAVYYPGSTAGQAWAKRLVRAIEPCIGHGYREGGFKAQARSWSRAKTLTNGRIVPDGTPLYVLKLTRAPAVILEPHFGSNQIDHRRSTLVRPQMAAALAAEIAGGAP